MGNAVSHCHVNVMAAHPSRVSFIGDDHAGARRAQIRSKGILTGRPFLHSPFVSKSSAHRAWATGQAPAQWTWSLRNRRSLRAQSKLFNLGLGKRCAEVVKGYLVLRHQVDPTQMTILSYGEIRPIVDNRTDQGRALNRHVEFKVLMR
jgi:hypothetical protein